MNVSKENEDATDRPLESVTSVVNDPLGHAVDRGVYDPNYRPSTSTSLPRVTSTDMLPYLSEYREMLEEGLISTPRMPLSARGEERNDEGESLGDKMAALQGVPQVTCNTTLASPAPVITRLYLS